MASTGKSATLFLQVLFALALLLPTSMARSNFHGFGEQKLKFPKQSSLKCNTVHGVQDGETCFLIAKQFGLTTAEFVAINPNVVCKKLFVGQWVCVDGETTN
ncbi:hypothetical protein MLD38_021108 [Melastoma candidum]|uniref:Uncharacterized protein n=1 Tax=Melastoma candidum TaxID=119954 RepID=A0ACB9QIW8_9MYRT|nr:hypothetical protein MLD38_021108 [Melastoma candidum]